MSSADERKLLLGLLKNKSGHKQDVFENTKEWFYVLKKELGECIDSLKGELKDDRVRLRFEDKGPGEVRLFIGSDVLVFHMHSNVFKLPNHDYSSQTSYIKDKPENAYCGIINVYDFLADSYEYNRPADVGYLICRIFINEDDHFKIQGKGPLGFMYKNLMHQKLTPEILHEVVLRIAVYALDFDLLTPPYQAVSQVSVGELLELSSNSKLKTGKRLGFKFQSDQDIEG